MILYVTTGVSGRGAGRVMCNVLWLGVGAAFGLFPTSAVGVVQLQDNIDATDTTAATPGAVQDFAVPLNLGLLTELP